MRFTDITQSAGIRFKHNSGRAGKKTFPNNHNGTFTNVTIGSGLDVEMYGMGVAVGGPERPDV